MSFAIETNKLTKRFGGISAVEDLSLHVNRGEIYAFLGLNGAGKTTAIRMLLGMIKPSFGTAYVLGTKIQRGGKSPWHEVGYLVETPSSYPELTVRENLEVMRRLRPGVSQDAIDRVINLVRLNAFAKRTSGTLSLGNLQRLGLAKALMHDPKLLILDEPANGLDPAGIVEIRELLITLAQQHGITVFMSSHILEEVARLADRIGIIDQGRLIQELSRNEIEQNRRKKLIIQARDSDGAQAVLRSMNLSAKHRPDNSIEIEDDVAIERPDEIATQMVDAGHAPTLLNIEHEALEHYFLRLVGTHQHAFDGVK